MAQNHRGDPQRACLQRRPPRRAGLSRQPRASGRSQCRRPAVRRGDRAHLARPWSRSATRTVPMSCRTRRHNAAPGWVPALAGPVMRGPTGLPRRRDRQAGQPPFGHPPGEAARGASLGPQQADGVVGEDAVGAAAVGDDLGARGQFGEPLPELADRDGDRAGDVPGGVFGGRADIEHGDLAQPGPAQQLVAGHLFDVIAQVGATRSGSSRRSGWSPPSPPPPGWSSPCACTKPGQPARPRRPPRENCCSGACWRAAGLSADAELGVPAHRIMAGQVAGTDTPAQRAAAGS